MASSWSWDRTKNDMLSQNKLKRRRIEFEKSVKSNAEKSSAVERDAADKPRYSSSNSGLGLQKHMVTSSDAAAQVIRCANIHKFFKIAFSG